MQTVQFIISTRFSSFWPINKTLSSATTAELNGTGSDGNEWLLCIPQSSNITGASPSDCLVSYPAHTLGESYSSAVIQSVYSTASADRAIQTFRIWFNIDQIPFYIQCYRCTTLLSTYNTDNSYWYFFFTEVWDT